MPASSPSAFGTWPSPIHSADLLRGAIGLGFPTALGGDIYWLESRPEEAGRTVVVRQRQDGSREDCHPAPFNARTRVHEYGGACYAVDGKRLYFTNFADQQIYAVALEGADRGPLPVTPADGRRWADLTLDPGRRRLIAVGEEDRAGGEPRNFLAAISLDGVPGEATVTELASDHDFFACPRVAPGGAELTWLAWDHPDMPWDSSILWHAGLDDDGSLTTPRALAGGQGESIFQPEWTHRGDLIFVSDRTGWWNLYQYADAGDAALAPRAADFGLPLWQFGMRTWAALADGRLACTWQDARGRRLGLLDLASGALTDVELPWTDLGGLVSDGTALVFIGAKPDSFPELVRFDPDTGSFGVLRRATDLVLAAADIAAPEAISFPTGPEGGEEIAHAYFYPPTHANCCGLPGELPPLLVMSHGGPTAATAPALSLKIQFWTSRGFAVADVNYRGSTGYGRAYRDRLKGNWGVVDVEDCANAARFLVTRGDVDPERLAIRGSSAGGFTTLAALTFHDLFRAGASLYGVGDLEALARDTHKFESRYLDSLVGPWPDAGATYRERSPIHHVDQLDCPVIFLQGLEDRIVPPSQAEAMVDALARKGVPVAYVAFEGEQHGFRQAANIRRALEAELYFYGQVFDFVPADTLDPVPIRNL